MPGTLVLWGVGTTRTLRPHWALQELGLDYDVKPITARSGETKTADYTVLNPRQKIPLLQDGFLTIGESAAIIAYLAQQYSSSGISLAPSQPDLFAQWLEWCFFIVTELDSTSLYVMRRHGTIQGLAHIYGEAPDVVQKAGEYFRDQLKHVEVALSDGRPYLLGDQFTTADILLTTCLTWAADYKVETSDKTRPYLERMTARPGYHAGQVSNQDGGVRAVPHDLRRVR